MTWWREVRGVCFSGRLAPMVRSKLPGVCLLWALTACSSNPPPRWAEGGAPLMLAEARWDRDGESDVLVSATGEVTADGELLFAIDRVGRVVDEDNDPVALLAPSGELLGNDGAYLGRVGLTNAAPPHSDTAWLSVLVDGTVIRFDDEGERLADGRWSGCLGPRQRLCTLVTHLVALHGYRRPASGTSVGFGVGVMM